MPALAGFVGGAYASRSQIVAGSQCINLFPEAVPEGGKAGGALYPVPGLPDFATLPTGPGRGIFAHKNRCWTVFGSVLYELAADGTPTARGGVVPDMNPVTFDTNGDAGGELFITSGDKGYLLDLATNVLTTPLASGSTQGGQLDSFFVSLNAATGTFRISDSLDGSIWNGLQIAQRTSASDPWVAMIIANNEIFLYGDKTGEAWYNAGLPTFPFAQRPEGYFQVGIAATSSLARFMSTVAFLGRTEHGNPKVFLMDGYTPTPISNAAIEWKIQQYQDAVGISDAVGWCYERENHSFYVLTFPKANHTWVYDGITKKWHERGFWDHLAADFIEYRPIFHAACFGKNLVCDSDGNKVYGMSSTTFTDVGGAELRRVRRTPHQSKENKKLFFSDAELECARGVGTANPPGNDPLVALRTSNDGGVTWGDSRVRPVGKRGEATTRVRWEGCGSGRDRQWEIWSSDPAATYWFDFYVNATVGRN